MFNPQETADNLKKSGAFIPGIRPGDQTARYIDEILTRLTLAGAIYIDAGVPAARVPGRKCNVPFYFGGTSLLIIVVVTMDFMAQVQRYVMTQQYESLLKKANFKRLVARCRRAEQGESETLPGRVKMGDTRSVSARCDVERPVVPGTAWACHADSHPAGARASSGSDRRVSMAVRRSVKICATPRKRQG